jgi:8-oxo-dGTP pyrophosphatase MutT (NUDIX family)
MSGEKFKLKCAVYLLPRKGNQVLLSLRQNTGYMDGQYSLVAGHIDGNETLEEAMAREAKEEAGITIRASDLKFVYLMHRLKDAPEDEYMDVFYEVTNWEGDITNEEPEKCGGLDWFDVTDLPDNTLDYVRHIIQVYPNGENYVSTRGVA